MRLSIVQPHGYARPQPRGWAAAAGGGSGADNWVAKPRGVLTSGAGTYQTFTIPWRYSCPFFLCVQATQGVSYTGCLYMILAVFKGYY